MGYIRVRDFAAENNCTAQNIYKHLRNYAKELEGHVIAGPGKQGQLLDDEAQTFLRSIMYPKAITVDNETMAAELAEMRAAMMKMGQENLKLAAQLAKTEGERDRALLDAGQFQRLLKASQEAEEAKDAELAQAKVDVAALTELAQEAQNESANLRKDLERERAEKTAALDQNQALKNRNWFERLTRKGE